mmetsp:Transcript_61635/g.73170  ORF Transcript_61635/g.73170 Transcript_61635/m.73170 type:complete len:191 (-) Transcript_61635:343-915(-)
MMIARQYFIPRASSSHSTSHDFGGGTLTSAEINQLRMISLSSRPVMKLENTLKTADIATTEDSNSWCGVDNDNLITLASVLENHVNIASHIDLIGEAHSRLKINPNVSASAVMDQWLQSVTKQGLTSHSLRNLSNGLSAASILISIMTTPYIDRCAISDDTIESCIGLLRQHLYKHVFVSLNNKNTIGCA